MITVDDIARTQKVEFRSGRCGEHGGFYGTVKTPYGLLRHRANFRATVLSWQIYVWLTAPDGEVKSKAKLAPLSEGSRCEHIVAIAQQLVQELGTLEVE